jgi:hypothetical protein
MGMEVAAARLGALYTTSDYASVVSINLFVALLCACIVLGHLLEENRWVNESITALIIGLCTGVVILLMTKGKSSHLFVFSEDLFFIYLLPPIIFNAGFQVKKKQFFRNFMTITLFGAVGTMISFFTISIAAIAIFSRMNIGTLDVGDFLGKPWLSFCMIMLALILTPCEHHFLLLTVMFNVQQLEPSFLRQILSAHCRSSIRMRHPFCTVWYSVKVL